MGGKPLKHLMALCSLDEHEWGGPVHQDLCIGAKRPKDDGDKGGLPGSDDAQTSTPRKKRRRMNLKALVLSCEVSLEQAQRSLPIPFERKRYMQSFRQGARRANNQ